jgi:hypothetical protein
MFYLERDGEVPCVTNMSREQLHKAMWAHIALRRKEGKPLAAIMFSFRPIHLTSLERRRKALEGKQ